MSDSTIMHCTPWGPRFEPAPLPDPAEPIPVTLTRKQWSAMLDHLNAELQPKLENKTATEAEIDIVVQLACALIGAGRARMDHEIVKRMLKGGVA